MRPFIGARELIQGLERWIIHPASIPLSTLRNLSEVRKLSAAVRIFREKSKSKPTQNIASTPNEFHVTVVPTKPYLVIPQVSSEKRNYAPIAWLSPPAIPSDKLRVLLDAPLHVFGILTSNMHMAWMRTVTGRLESRYMYSVGVVYNTFPMPQASDAQLAKLEPLAQAILDARASHTGSTLADLYDPDLMPANLRKAHTALDKAVDKLYRKSGFSSDSERVEHLLGMYEKIVVPLTAPVKKTIRRKKS